LPFSQKDCYVRYQFFSFVVYAVEGSIKKRWKKWGPPFKKIGDDVIAQKGVTSPKQAARHRTAPFKIKSTRPSDLPKNITLRYYEFCSKLYAHTVYKTECLFVCLFCIQIYSFTPILVKFCTLDLQNRGKIAVYFNFIRTNSYYHFQSSWAQSFFELEIGFAWYIPVS
jgi:hypothetical protein